MGGAFGRGTVFRLTPGPNGEWSETVLHSFQQDGRDGVIPRGGVIVDKAGSVWGTTSAGGENGGGTVFELTPGPNDTWSETLLSLFTTYPDPDRGSYQAGPYQPLSDLIFDKAGNIYGTTTSGGFKGNDGRAGTVFEVKPGPNGKWALTVLHIFTGGEDGGLPDARLMFDAAGNLYGTTVGGGGRPRRSAPEDGV